MMRPLFFISLCLYAGYSFAVEPATTTSSLTKNLARTVLAQERLIRQMQQEVQQLRGDNETFNYQLSKLREQQRNFYADLDDRLRQIESGNFGTVTVEGKPAIDTETAITETVINPETNNTAGNTSKKATIKPPPFTGKDPQTPHPKGTKAEKTAYQNAFMTLQRGKPQRAIEKFQTFIKTYPYGTYADNAQYWLGEAYYSLSDFRSALTEFNGLLENHPDSKKQAHALLKVGFCYYELRDRKRAKAILKNVMERFPTTATARLAEKRLDRLRSEGW